MGGTSKVFHQEMDIDIKRTALVVDLNCYCGLDATALISLLLGSGLEVRCRELKLSILRILQRVI